MTIKIELQEKHDAIVAKATEIPHLISGVLSTQPVRDDIAQFCSALQKYIDNLQDDPCEGLIGEELTSCEEIADGQANIDYYLQLLTTYDELVGQIETLRLQLSGVEVGNRLPPYGMTPDEYIASLRETITTFEETEAALLAEGGVDIFRSALQTVYGITINDSNVSLGDDVIQAFQIINNYRIGAETFDIWLQANYDITFLEVFGAVEVVRTTDSNLDATTRGFACPNGNCAFGYTSDHTIFDIFTGNRTSIMTSENFLHELAHVFINSAGFGQRLLSPLTTDNDALVREVKYILSLNSDYETTGNEVSGEHEMIANFIQNLVAGRIRYYSEILNEDQRLPFEIETLIDETVETNVTRLNVPEGEFIQLTGGAVGVRRARFDINPNTVLTNSNFPLIGQTNFIIPLGISENGYINRFTDDDNDDDTAYTWAYVVFEEIISNNILYNYGWIRSDLVKNRTDFDVDSLLEIPFP